MRLPHGHSQTGGDPVGHARLGDSDTGGAMMRMCRPQPEPSFLVIHEFGGSMGFQRCSLSDRGQARKPCSDMSLQRWQDV